MPVQGPIHVDRPLTNISIAYKSEGLIADMVFPAVPVAKESDQYYVFDKAHALRTPQTLRANGAEANEDQLVLSTAAYTLEEHALKDIITNRDREKQDPGVNLEVSTVEDLTDKILRQKEVDAATLMFTNGNWANETSLGAAAAFSVNTTATNPLLIFDSAATTVLTSSGRKANTGILDYRTFQACKNHVSVVDRIKYTSADSVTPLILKNLMEVDTLLIAEGAQTTAAEGLAATMALIWTDSAWLGYIERSPGLRKPSAAYCYKRSTIGVQVKRWRDEPRSGEWFQVGHLYDQVNPSTDAGYLIVDTVQ